MAFAAFSFGAAVPVCGLHPPLRRRLLLVLERLAGWRLQAVDEEEGESRVSMFLWERADLDSSILQI